jgi:hypothetical protein
MSTPLINRSTHIPAYTHAHAEIRPGRSVMLLDLTAPNPDGQCSLLLCMCPRAPTRMHAPTHMYRHTHTTCNTQYSASLSRAHTHSFSFSLTTHILAVIVDGADQDEPWTVFFVHGSMATMQQFEAQITGLHVYLSICLSILSVYRIYVCTLRVYMYICIHARTHTHTYMKGMYACMYVCMYVGTMHVRMYVRMHACTHACARHMHAPHRTTRM